MSDNAHDIAPIILASQSSTRKALLNAAHVPYEAKAAMIDEQAIITALVSSGAAPRDMADSLAEAKALKLSFAHPERLVLGCDQILAAQDGRIFGKPDDVKQAREQLCHLRGATHGLYSAGVIALNGEVIWRQVEIAKLSMRHFSDAFLDDYLARYWQDIRHCAGCYRIEAEGAQLFTRISGSYHAILGMPLFPLMGILREWDILPS